MPGHKDWYNVVFNPKFSISFDPYAFDSMEMMDAASHTAKLMKEANPNCWISMSGGMDSEFVANTFYENSLEFTPIIWRDPFNKESDMALHWCRKRNLSPVMIERDMRKDPLFKLFNNISDRFGSTSVVGIIPVYLAYIAAKQGGSLITGTGIMTPDPLYPTPMGPFAEFSDHDYFVDSLSGHHGSFFLYTPEICYAMLESIDSKMPTQEFKSQIYKIPFRAKMRPYHLDGMIDHRDNYDNSYDFESLKSFMFGFCRTKYPIPNGQK